MVEENKNHGNNLFKVDLDGIENILAEVHKDHIKDTSSIDEKYSELPDEFSSSEDLENAKEIIGEINILTKKWSTARNKEVKPLREAVKRGSDWYKEYENPLKDKKNSVENRINEYLKKEKEKEELESEIELEDEVEVEEEFVEMVQSATREEELDELLSSSEQQVISEVPTKYAVVDFNRKKIPMEKLEPYFTDHQLKTAITKHMNEHGPTLGGVNYDEVVDL